MLCVCMLVLQHFGEITLSSHFAKFCHFKGGDKYIKKSDSQAPAPRLDQAPDTTCVLKHVTCIMS